MNINSNENRAPRELGYLVVRVSTALGAIPLENATVNVRGTTRESSGILYSLLSDRDGLTARVSLPTPPRSASDTPGGPPPYSSWNIEVFKEGYIAAKFLNVPVYSSIVSVQPAVLVPLGEKTDKGEIYNESSGPSL
jgi:hypothetical protein